MGISAALGSSALLPAGLGFRNLVINGDMRIDQRNGGASATSASAGYVWPVDRFKFYQAAGSKITGQRLAKSAASTNAPTGFQYSLKLTNAASGTTPAAGDEYELYHIIEGNSLANLDWGYSTAKPIVLSFWVRSSVTGTYAVSLYNAGTNNRSYISTYTINAADTWEQKTIYVNGDTSGTWTIGASTGLGIIWDMGSGGSYNTTAGAWTSGFYTRTSGATTWISTANATFYITGVQLEQNYQPTPFEQRPYGVELQLCQRYYEKTYSIAVSPGTNTSDGKRVNFGVSDGSGNVGVDYRFKQEKRSTSYTATFYTQGGTAGSWDYGRSGATGTVTMVASNYATSGFYFYSNTVGANWSACWISGHLVFNDEL